MKPGGNLRRTELRRTGGPARKSEITRSPWSPAVPYLPPQGKSAARKRSGPVPSATAPRTQTGFSRKVKLQVRTRAGSGDPDNARCECCGLWLGRYGGQIQHLVARGMGGTSDPVLKTAANAALLCGTAQSGDHGLAESRDREMGAKGFWLPQGTDPRTVPMMLASEHGSGVLVWRTEDGRYSFEAPEGLVA
jgi:hypothetical protein